MRLPDGSFWLHRLAPDVRPIYPCALHPNHGVPIQGDALHSQLSSAHVAFHAVPLRQANPSIAGVPASRLQVTWCGAALLVNMGCWLLLQL